MSAFEKDKGLSVRVSIHLVVYGTLKATQSFPIIFHYQIITCLTRWSEGRMRNGAKTLKCIMERLSLSNA
ncbi:unnamed protein product [Clonostachys rosea f. rosea IK726]|uniref:Uncharacterized protein n=1 Tax=Clonostachys rosea f. rosea IK726 TaxID=1349383 RepID=A0ACA9UM61_BIOOC|nr:unnamed protein product [Clonostachys rosea f. rosea IK726]